MLSMCGIQAFRGGEVREQPETGLHLCLGLDDFIPAHPRPLSTGKARVGRSLIGVAPNPGSAADDKAAGLASEAKPATQELSDAESAKVPCSTN